MNKTKKALRDMLEARAKTIKRQLSQNKLSDSDRETLADEQERVDAALRDLADASEEVDESDLRDIVGKYKELAEAMEAVKERLAAEKNEPEVVQDYLKSEQSVHDLARCLRENKLGEWAEICGRNGVRVQNGVTLATGAAQNLMPTFVTGRIQDIIDRDYSWLNDLRATGAKAFRLPYLGGIGPGTQLHTAGQKKTDSEVTLNAVEITPKMVYGLVKIDRMTEWQDDFGLVSFVVDLLAKDRVRKIEWGLLARQESRNFDIAPNLKRRYATTLIEQTPTQEALVNTILAELGEVGGDDRDKIIIFNTIHGWQNIMRSQRYAAGGTVDLLSRQQIADMFGVKDVLFAKWEYTDGDIALNGAFVVNPREIYTVGSLTGTLARWEDYEYNMIGHRLEAPFGAGSAFTAVSEILAAGE